MQPDVAVLPEGARPTGRDWKAPTPVWVAEILSPSTASRDRNVKVAKYLARGVEEVWLVDPGQETVEVHAKSGARKASGAEMIPSGALPDLKLAAAAVFER